MLIYFLTGRFGDTDLLVNGVAAVVLLHHKLCNCRCILGFRLSTLAEASFGDGLKGEEEQKEVNCVHTHTKKKNSDSYG
ncbi:hypothetical protein RHMOL_Rhmol02G0297200 [Rhododendron molle]|uniref:Uncharacterized protein n=1 Tax=Rhododendron molle TaxID=49168 RepID=A0ACC0PVB2_RHOML|nr:hypothetical protein RHMOL_Rhmol02G0297200 [Rhododendron molle]